METLLEAGADVNHKDNHRTCLMRMALAGEVDATGILLDNKADPNLKDIDGWTVLHYASARHHVEIVRMLLGKASINVRSNN